MPKLNITYSAYREMELFPEVPCLMIKKTIDGLLIDPFPNGSRPVQGQLGCHYIEINDCYEGIYILYHINDDDDFITILGVLRGSYHPFH